MALSLRIDQELHQLHYASCDMALVGSLSPRSYHYNQQKWRLSMCQAWWRSVWVQDRLPSRLAR